MTDDSSPEGRFEYIGNELELFLHAENWKSYVSQRVRPYINGSVLEVGAGIGANTPYLYRNDLNRFVSLEPDAELCQRYRQRLSEGQIPSDCELTEGTLETLVADEMFDTLLYFDVLEHIEDDAAEFERAMRRLNPGGHLIILCPAHHWLFSPFDEAIGHFRRYNKRLYRGLSVQAPHHMEYLDSIGLFASLANRMFLKQSYPGLKQITTWDRWFVPLSRRSDPLTFRQVGKSILGIWKAK